MSLKRALIGLVTAAALVAGRGSALAAGSCSAANACKFADLPAACCDNTTCTIDGTITIGGSVCDIDFGPRNVTLTSTGTILLGSNTLSIEAGSVTVAGTINGRGSSPNHGGRLVVTTNGGTANAFRLTGSMALIDLSGFADGGGSLEIHGDGPIGILGGKILSSQLEPNASGGTIQIDNTVGAITVAAPIRAEAGLNGLGGLIDLGAATDLTITDTGLVSAASGGAFGGEIDFEANGTFTMSGAASAQATSLTNSAGDGGDINITAGSIVMQGYLEAKGGSDTTGTEGGSGGSISLEADTGQLLVTGNQGIVADGAGGGDGGDVSLLTQAPTVGTLQVATTVSASATGGVAERPAGGGEIDITSAANLTITKKVFVTGGGGGTGFVEIVGQQDVFIENTIDGSDPVGGGSIDIDTTAGHDIIVTNAGFDTPIRMNATTDGNGGSISMEAGNDLVIGAPSPAANSVLLTATGAGSGGGGTITLTASRNVSIRKNATVTANTPLTSTLQGGSISVAAGSPDLTGALQIDGQVTAKGRTTSSVQTPGQIALSGCQLTISSTGTVDSSGDVNAFNTVTARKGITIAGHLTATATGQNLIAYPSGVTPPSGASVSPPFTCSGTCPKPLCTQLNPPVPTGCLVPCPDCPNTTDPTNGQFPEECGTPGCAKNCDNHCRHFLPAGCDDGNSCTMNACDDTYGCVNPFVANGTQCNDADACTITDTCLNGACTGAETPNCDDGKVCTVDTCAAASGCTHTPVTCPAPANKCYGASVCVEPTGCEPGPLKVCPAGQVCNPADGTCVVKPCTTAADCADGNPCTSKSCPSGTCVTTPVANGPAAGCTDNDVCNGTETCQSGVCTPATPLSCDDGDPCTDDTCDSVHGCMNTPIQNCCLTVGDCNDQNHCTNDSCVANRCEHILDPNCCDTNAGCDDLNPCTTDTCVNQLCSHVPVADHTNCGDACTAAQCLSGACVLGATTACVDDGDICTEDFCDPAQGCIHPAIEGCCHTNADCDDQNICTSDVCDPDRHVCVNAPLLLGCQVCASDTDCDPLGACGQRICCTTVAAGTPCEFVTGICSDETYAPRTCETGNTKVKSSCVADGGGQAHCTAPVCLCDDQNACNGVETCGQNVCVAGTAPDCDDHDSCTDDACDPGAGCTHTARTGFDSVSCRLDAIALDLQQATAASVTPPVRSKLSKLLGKARTKLSAAHNANGKRALKNLKAAGSALKQIGNAVAGARRKNKIDGGLADAITTSAQGAAAAIETLKTSITPA